MTLLDLVEDTTTITTPAEPGDHDAFAHYVKQDDIIRATFDGIPAKALCGKVWAATKSPEGKTVCPECKEIWEGFAQ